MDILISSNAERLVYKIAGADDAKDAAFMKELSEKGVYTISPEMKEKLTDFYGNYASEEETAAEIARLYKEADYVIDTHTAVASAVYRKYRQETGDEAVTVIASTASPYKFARSVMDAIDKKYDVLDDFGLVDELSRISGTAVPKAVEELRTAPVLHDTVVEKDEMKSIVKKILNDKISFITKRNSIPYAFVTAERMLFSFAFFTGPSEEHRAAVWQRFCKRDG